MPQTFDFNDLFYSSISTFSSSSSIPSTAIDKYDFNQCTEQNKKRNMLCIFLAMNSYLKYYPESSVSSSLAMQSH